MSDDHRIQAGGEVTDVHIKGAPRPLLTASHPPLPCNSNWPLAELLGLKACARADLAAMGTGVEKKWL
jgi:hypothetical protein